MIKLRCYFVICALNETIFWHWFKMLTKIVQVWILTQYTNKILTDVKICHLIYQKNRICVKLNERVKTKCENWLWVSDCNFIFLSRWKLLMLKLSRKIQSWFLWTKFFQILKKNKSNGWIITVALGEIVFSKTCFSTSVTFINWFTLYSLSKSWKKYNFLDFFAKYISSNYWCICFFVNIK